MIIISISCSSKENVSFKGFWSFANHSSKYIGPSYPRTTLFKLKLSNGHNRYFTFLRNFIRQACIVSISPNIHYKLLPSISLNIKHLVVSQLKFKSQHNPRIWSQVTPTATFLHKDNSYLKILENIKTDSCLQQSQYYGCFPCNPCLPFGYQSNYNFRSH